MASISNSSLQSAALQSLLQRQDLWRLHDRDRGAATGLPTEFAELDALLHGGGWPRAALTELLVGQAGIGELQLLLPALSSLSRQQLWQVWINPRFIPYAPELVRSGIALEQLLIVRTADPKQQLWVCEQALRSAACGAVLYWPTTALRYAELRKLQVAATAQQGMAFLLRDPRCAAQSSPAALRLQLRAAQENLSVEILKQRGGRAGQQVLLPRPAALHAQEPLRERDDSSMTVAMTVAMTEKLFSESASRIAQKTIAPRSIFTVTPLRELPL